MEKIETTKKRGKGRPKLKNSKDIKVTVRFSEKEHKSIKKYMRKNKIKTISPFMRKLVLAKVLQMDLFESD